MLDELVIYPLGFVALYGVNPSAVVTSPEDSVTAPVRVLKLVTPPSIWMFPDPNTEFPLTVLIDVPDTSAVWYVLAAVALVRYGDSAELVMYPESLLSWLTAVGAV